MLTTDRVIYRSGVIAKHGIEIPLQRINTIFFSQRIFERLLGLGDLKIESASETGAQVFEDIRSPDKVQHDIYAQMEANENRGLEKLGDRLDAAGRRRRRAGAGAGRAVGHRSDRRAAPAAPGRGPHRRRVRGQEGRAARPHVAGSAIVMRPAELRVVSLVPSVTETLLAWGITPVGVTRFCEQPTLRGGRRHQGPRRRRHRRAGARPRRDVPRGEPAGGRRRAGRRGPAGSRPCASSRWPTSSAGWPQLAAAVGVDRARSRSSLPPVDGARRTAFVPIWRRPWMTMAADTYGASLLAALGIDVVVRRRRRPLPGDGSGRSGVAARPDLVLAPSEPYPFGARHVAELESVAPVVLVDGQDLFWWGARTPLALERLAAVLARPEIPEVPGDRASCHWIRPVRVESGDKKRVVGSGRGWS